MAFGLAHYDVLNEKARGLDIAGLPHFIVYRSGSKIDEFSGWSEKWLRNAVNKHSSSASSSSSEASNGQVTHVASKREFDAFISKDVTIVDLYAKWLVALTFCSLFLFFFVVLIRVFRCYQVRSMSNYQVRRLLFLFRSSTQKCNVKFICIWSALVC